MIKSSRVKTLAILGGTVDLGSFPLLHLARAENRRDVGNHQVRQLLVAHPGSVGLLYCSVGARLAMALPVTTHQEDPYENHVPHCMHRLYGKQYLPCPGR